MADFDRIKKVFVPFIDEQPGHEFSHLQKRKHEVIPVTFLENIPYIIFKTWKLGRLSTNVLQKQRTFRRADKSFGLNRICLESI